MDYEDLLSTAIEIINEAGTGLLKSQNRAKEIKKQGKDFLTEADLFSHNFILKRLKELTPEIPVYSEEGEIELTNKPTWVIDPLDGTMNFSYQDVFWGVSMALLENMKTTLAVIYLPALKQLAGVTKEGQIITKGFISLGVRKQDVELSRAEIWLDYSKKSNSIRSIFPKMEAVSFRPQIRRCASAAFMAVAGGKISAYVVGGPAIEDIAAGYLIVEQAGGSVTDLNGNKATPFSESIIASNGILNEQISRVLK